jgi:large subunit ribosomal protein L15
MKIKKTKKSVKQRGNTTHGHGARKKWKGSGHHGGKGMAGTGKRADQKTTLVQKKYGNDYFGKQGITSKRVAQDKTPTLNLRDIQNNIHSLLEKYGKNDELILKKYKILGTGELTQKINITAKEFSKSAISKIESIGGTATSLKKESIKIKDSEKNPEK